MISCGSKALGLGAELEVDLKISQKYYLVRDSPCLKKKSCLFILVFCILFFSYLEQLRRYLLLTDSYFRPRRSSSQLFFILNTQILPTIYDSFFQFLWRLFLFKCLEYAVENTYQTPNTQYSTDSQSHNDNSGSVVL